jgi:hypothetical protein
MPPDSRTGPASAAGPAPTSSDPTTGKRKKSASTIRRPSVSALSRRLRWAQADLRDARREYVLHRHECTICAKSRGKTIRMCPAGQALNATIAELEITVERERELAERPLPGQMAFDFESPDWDAVVEDPR